MPDYTPKLGLYKPNRNDAIEIDTSLADNFTLIDNKVSEIDSDLQGKATEIKQLKDDIGKVGDNVKPPYMVAHRGYSGYAPENTMPAFEEAVKAGFKAVECDVQFTSDDEIILMHDSTVTRTTNGTGAIADKTLAQMKALDAGSWFSSKYAGTKVPTLDELLDYCKANGVIPFVEIKGTFTQAQMNAVAQKIVSKGMAHHAIIISFGYDNLEKVRNTNQEIELGYLTNGFTTALIDQTFALGNSFIDAKHGSIDDSGVQYCKSLGLTVGAWTVNNVDDMQKLLRLGVTAVTSDLISNTQWGAGVVITRGCVIKITDGEPIIDDRFANTGVTGFEFYGDDLMVHYVDFPTARRPIAMVSMDQYSVGYKYGASGGYANLDFVRIKITDENGNLIPPANITGTRYINLMTYSS